MSSQPHSLSSSYSAKDRSASLWVSILYFAEGFPYTVVNLMSVIFLKDLGASNELIGLTSFLYLPWALKGVWGPVVDIYSTKRRWILSTEVVCVFFFGLLAVGALSGQAIMASIVVFALIAFTSATHDIAIDGFYLDALDTDRQAFYVGFRSTAYKLAWLAGNGGLVFLAGYLSEKYVVAKNPDGSAVFGNVSLNLLGRVVSFHAQEFGWSVSFAIAALLFLAIYLFQLWYLPHPKIFRKDHVTANPSSAFFDSFRTYFSQEKIGWIVAYVLIFRLGDAFMLKMAPPFLMDHSVKGGLAISTAEIGILYGTVGVIFLLAGGIVGGFVIAKQGLKKWMWPTALLQNFAIVLYWFLAKYKPQIEWVYVVNSFEQLSYGLGVSAYTVFLMRTVRPEFKASHYAITTAFMAAGVLLPGVLSGYLQTAMGYENYFLMSFLVAIPGLMTIYFLPLEASEKR
ncbi:MAG TPA: MFS transporter [Bacteroidota bacterium]|nr:MFS transporter [Bacteroidota bacterium]